MPNPPRQPNLQQPPSPPRRPSLLRPLNPLRPSTSGDVAAGKQVFEQNCNACHPGGGQGAGPALKGKNLSADRITRQVRNGGEGMPAFSPSQISDQQLNNLVQYVQSLQ